MNDDLYDGLEPLGNVGSFDKLQPCDRAQTEKNLGLFAQIEALDLDKRKVELFDWKRRMVNALPADIKDNVHVMTVEKPNPVVQEYLDVIHATHIQGAPVRDALREIHYAVADWITTDQPRDLSMTTLVPIVRGAIPGYFGAEDLIYRKSGEVVKASVAAIRICRGDGKRDDLRFYLDQNMSVIKSEDIHGRDIDVVDSATATGGSMVEAAQYVHQFDPRSIRFHSMTLTPYAAIQIVRNMRTLGIETQIYASDIGEVRESEGYILESVGDVGHRAHGTKKNGEVRNMDGLMLRYSLAERIRNRHAIERIYATSGQEVPQALGLNK